LGKINNKRSLIGLRNLSEFIMVCLRNPSAAGELFLVSDQEDLSTADLVQRIGGFLGRPTHIIPLPYQFMSILAHILGKKDAFHKLCHSLQVDVEKSRNVLHWNPPFSVNEELEQTIRWYKYEYKRH
jgi:nucleoside-diphosphate-sugar epimerase